MAKSLKLKISSCPSKDMVYENCVFLNPKDFKSLELNKSEQFVAFQDQIDSIVYMAKPSLKTETECIGLSQVARQACKVNTGDVVSVKKFLVPPNENPNLVYVKLLLKTLTGAIDTTEDTLTDLLTQKLAGVILSTGAIYIFDFQGQGVFSASVDVLKVALPNAPNEADGFKVTRFGALTKHSALDLAVEGKSLKLSQSSRPTLFGPKWRYGDMGIGGLDDEFARIFRRAFASRTLPARVMKKLGVEHVRGLLLFGPPGTGKTLIARQIGKMLQGREPKIVNGPEILNKYVGQSEENIRALFSDAEEDYKLHGDDADLHIIIFDEIDAICKQRGSTGGGTGVHDTVVNQLLSKMDGVDSLNNVLVIGMTNRKDMIDSALLRPGRFEGLPDEKGREEILKIHTRAIREHGFMGDDVDLAELARLTKNFSGAEISGLVKSATSFAYYGGLDLDHEKVTAERVEATKIGRDAFLQALTEVKSAFGMSEERIKRLEGHGVVQYNAEFTELHKTCFG